MYKSLLLLVLVAAFGIIMADRPDVASTIPDSFVAKIKQKDDTDATQQIFVNKQLNKAKSVQTVDDGDDTFTFTTIVDFEKG